MAGGGWRKVAGIPVLPHVTGVPVTGGNGLDGREWQTSLYCLTKRYCCATTGASSLTMKNVPYHEDVKQFGHAICAARNGEGGRGGGGMPSALHALVRRGGELEWLSGFGSVLHEGAAKGFGGGGD